MLKVALLVGDDGSLLVGPQGQRGAAHLLVQLDGLAVGGQGLVVLLVAKAQPAHGHQRLDLLGLGLEQLDPGGLAGLAAAGRLLCFLDLPCAKREEALHLGHGPAEVLEEGVAVGQEEQGPVQVFVHLQVLDEPQGALQPGHRLPVPFLPERADAGHNRGLELPPGQLVGLLTAQAGVAVHLRRPRGPARRRGGPRQVLLPRAGGELPQQARAPGTRAGPTVEQGRRGDAHGVGHAEEGHALGAAGQGGAVHGEQQREQVTAQGQAQGAGEAQVVQAAPRSVGEQEPQVGRAASVVAQGAAPHHGPGPLQGEVQGAGGERLTGERAQLQVRGETCGALLAGIHHHPARADRGAQGVGVGQLPQGGQADHRLPTEHALHREAGAQPPQVHEHPARPPGELLELARQPTLCIRQRELTEGARGELEPLQARRRAWHHAQQCGAGTGAAAVEQCHDLVSRRERAEHLLAGEVAHLQQARHPGETAAEGRQPGAHLHLAGAPLLKPHLERSVRPGGGLDGQDSAVRGGCLAQRLDRIRGPSPPGQGELPELVHKGPALPLFGQGEGLQGAAQGQGEVLGEAEDQGAHRGCAGGVFRVQEPGWGALEQRTHGRGHGAHIAGAVGLLRGHQGVEVRPPVRLGELAKPTQELCRGVLCAAVGRREDGAQPGQVQPGQHMPSQALGRREGPVQWRQRPLVALGIFLCVLLPRAGVTYNPRHQARGAGEWRGGLEQVVQPGPRGLSPIFAPRGARGGGGAVQGEQGQVCPEGQAQALGEHRAAGFFMGRLASLLQGVQALVDPRQVPGRPPGSGQIEELLGFVEGHGHQQRKGDAVLAGALQGLVGLRHGLTEAGPPPQPQPGHGQVTMQHAQLPVQLLVLAGDHCGLPVGRPLPQQGLHLGPHLLALAGEPADGLGHVRLVQSVEAEGRRGAASRTDAGHLLHLRRPGAG